MANVVRFDCFEVDLSTRQLYKRGTRINLRDKSFQVLASLLEHQGEVVTREELCEQLWGEDVFVDFENNLNTAVARLRQALSDSADHPRFIETLPKHGYRFLASSSYAGSQAEATKEKRLRLLVLPFINLSGDSAQEYFSDAVTDAMITELAQQSLEQLAIIARTTAMCYKGRLKQAARIGREVQADFIVEGSVHRTQDRIGLNIQLIRASDQIHIFAQKYTAPLQDIAALQNNIAETIVAHLNTHGLRSRLRSPLVKNAPFFKQDGLADRNFRPVDPNVLDLTIKGKATLEYATREAQVHEAIKLFQRAIDIDPTYAPAWAGLGEALWYLAAAGLEFVPPIDVRDKAIAAAEKALELDETLPDAHKARAAIAIDAEWNLAKAQSHFERVLQLQPDHAAAHNLYGQLFAVLRRFDEAQQHFIRARELDPLSPWNDINLLGWWMLQGRPAKALEEGKRAWLRNPTVWTIRCLTGGAELLLGRAARAIPEFEEALRLLHPERPSALLAPLGLAHGLAGSRTGALRILAELNRTSQERYVSLFSLAVVNSGLGRMDEAFRFLDHALEQRTPYLICCTRNDGNSIALRRDPRWKSFIERLRRLVSLPPDSPNPYS